MDSMGGMMTMAPGVPSLFYMQQIFWAFVGTAIGVATTANILNRILYHQRISSSRNVPGAAKPRSFFFQAHATTSAIIREFSYYSKPLSFRNRHFYLPPVGPVMMMVGYAVLIVVCVFYRLDPKDFLQWEDIGYRSGFIAVCQMPLIVLLAGKRNIIGFFTGVGYERLAWLHRWVARALLFTVFIHMGFWFSEWAKYDYVGVKVKTDALTQRGIAAGSVLLWLVLSSVAPIRKLSYEFFIIQHIISWLGFFTALYFHVPEENRIWIWLPLGFWAFDRFVRAVYLIYANLSLLHKNSTGFLSCRATFEPLDESHTRITITNPPITWTAGQHLFLACHPLAPLSSHPFTIASLPEDGKLEFVVRAKKGATRRFFKYAEKAYSGLPTATGKRNNGRSVLIDGPYATIRPLRQFDSLVFIAGSTGATFTMPLMRDIVQECKGTKPTTPSRLPGLSTPAGAVTRHIRFVWVVKRKAAVEWFASQLDQVIRDVEGLRNEGYDIAVDISIYITCDDALTSGQSSIMDGAPRDTKTQNGSSDSSPDEKKALTENIEETLSRASSSSTKDCCCTRLITDENAITRPATAHPGASTSKKSQLSQRAPLENQSVLWMQGSTSYQAVPTSRILSGRRPRWHSGRRLWWCVDRRG
ncbi:Ferric reductase transmembrane component [Lachnellula willkommii]|uniref:ferric-chelate reductase (NADPH) n=1 Tax=Lachnellula willkommii TaxID=215461 RepID=A0A559MDH8_9HELO|nr:Ferric reductase transmembrane component [Lachnellula willkommii]